MNKILILTLGLVLFLIERCEMVNNGPVIECRIYNDFYKQYLYGAKRLPNIFTHSKRGVFLWKEYDDFLSVSNKIEYSESDPAGIWLFESVDPLNGTTFLLRNKKYPNEYLSSSDKFREVFAENKNRMVYVREPNQNGKTDEALMWTFKSKSNEANMLFQMWNVKHGEALYAKGNFADHLLFSGTRRRVNLMSGALPNTDQFDWVLKCNNGLMPF
jgi:hypothetical protein